jgi:membrane associated rhomboid family serine protease
MSGARDSWKRRLLTLVAFLGAMWFVWLLDAITPGRGSAAGHGIVPRTSYGLQGIPVAPLIHANLRHLAANTVPFAILGALVLIGGTTELIFVVLVSTLVGGLGTWLFGAGNAQHIGASGVVFGLFGFLLFRAAFDRRLLSVLITILVALLYGSAMASSLIPESSVSWSSHFFGAVGGATAARLRHPSRRT